MKDMIKMPWTMYVKEVLLRALYVFIPAFIPPLMISVNAFVNCAVYLVVRCKPDSLLHVDLLAWTASPRESRYHGCC